MKHSFDIRIARVCELTPVIVFKVNLKSAGEKSSTLSEQRFQFPVFFGHPGPIYLAHELLHLQNLQLKRWAVKDEVVGEKGSRDFLSGLLRSARFSPGLLMSVGALITEASQGAKGRPWAQVSHQTPVPPSSINSHH